jgi:hypothetical protein
MEAASNLPDSAEFFHEEVQSLTDRIMNLFGPWVPSDRHEDMRIGLENIFETAVRFSQLLRRQRACWSVCFPHTRMAANAVAGQTQRTMNETLPSPAPTDACRYDPLTMEDIDEDGMDHEEDAFHHSRQVNVAKQVQLLITPALFKRGNADGDKYEVQACLVKSIVKCV